MKPDWDKIKKHLQDKDCVMYYAGGTLCIDFPEGGLIGLNLAGAWFIAGSVSEPSDAVGADMPPDILELVKKTYLEVKGETAHYVMETTGELAAAQR